jgi:type IV pilus assembly protein PilO
LILLGLVGALTAFWLYLLGPQIAAFGELRREAAVLERELAVAEALVAGMPAEREALARAEAELNHLRALFAADIGDGLLVVEMGLRAAGDGVEVILFRPREAVEEAHLVAVPIEVGVRGTYPAVLRYLESLQHLPNAAEVRELSFRAERDEHAGLVRAEALLLVYADPAPNARFPLSHPWDWRTGRPDAFRPGDYPAAGVAPAPQPGVGEPADVPGPAPLPEEDPSEKPGPPFK